MRHNTFPLPLSVAAFAVSGCVVPAPDFVGSPLGCADGDGCPTGFSCDGGGVQCCQHDGLGVPAWGGVYACREVESEETVMTCMRPCELGCAKGTFCSEEHCQPKSPLTTP